MSTAVVLRPVAVVSPWHFTPVEQGRILPPVRRQSDSLRPLHDHPSAPISTAATISSRHLSSSSSDDEAASTSGTRLLSGATSPLNRNVCIVSPSSRRDERERSDRATDVVGPTVPVTNLTFYHGAISSHEAKNRLQGHPVGTFLLRDSQSRDPQFPFAISAVVKTPSSRCQVQSIRVTRCQQTGTFSLDCPEDQLRAMPQFQSVKSLTDFLMTSSRTVQTLGDSESAVFCVLVGRQQGQAKLPLLLTQPLSPSPPAA